MCAGQRWSEDREQFIDLGAGRVWFLDLSYISQLGDPLHRVDLTCLETLPQPAQHHHSMSPSLAPS